MRAYGVVLVIVLGLTYANSLSGAFVLDDQATVVQNPQIRDLSRPRDVLVPAADSPIAGRPLASLTFALNYAFGGLDVRGYHAVNIALHALCALLVMALVRRAIELSQGGREAPIDAWPAAFGAALLWGVHPLNSEVVDYLTQRTESLMAACYLLTLYGAMRAGEAYHGRSSRGRWEALSVIACAAGALSKESIATAPLMVVVLDRVLLFDSWRAIAAVRRRLYAGLAASWLILGTLLAASPRAAVAGFASGVSPWVYLLNQARMITEYIRLTVWPDSLVVFYGWPAPLTLPDVAMEFAVIAAIGVLTAVALWRRPPLGLLGVWFFATLAPASSIVPVATEVGAERRMYLPLVAVCVLGATAVHSAARRVRLARVQAWAPLVLIGAAATALATVTVMRNREYESALTLTRTIVERRPTAVAHHMYAEQLILAGRQEDALPHLRAAVEMGNSRAGYLLGQTLAARGERGEAIAQLEAFVRTYRPPVRPVPQWLEPPLSEVIPARFLLGRALGLQGEWTRAAEQGRLILETLPGHVGARGLLGDALFAQQQWSAAAEHYREYLKRQPGDVRALLNYGITQVAGERLDEAIDVFTRAAQLEPANDRARQLLAMAQEDRARLPEERGP